MTSSVTINAHCSKDKEVVVNISTEYDDNDYILQDGEFATYHVHDNKAILVYEQFKNKENENAG